MAISKILYIGGCGAGYSGKHLKQALDYITDKEKTGNGRWISSINCQAENAYKQMHKTKEHYGKTEQRQGYHIIISFVDGEISAETAFEVIGKFAKEYLGKEYETLYTIHDNTEHIHGHIIFNSVSFLTGRKYRYEKGDWAKNIQPITNCLCEEYGLSTIEIAEDRERLSENYKEWNDFRDGKFVWSDMIKRDLDACILQAATYESFLVLLSNMGYEIKNAFRNEGKYLAIKPMKLTRFRRCKSFGDTYTEEQIRERISKESFSTFQQMKKMCGTPRIVPCKVKRYRKAKMSRIQKRYFAKLYRIGLLKKRPYSQAYQYRNEIRKMGKLQEEYHFLSRNDSKSIAEIKATIKSISDKKREISKEKSRVFKERARMKPLFDLMEEMEDLKVSDNYFLHGEILFQKEHDRCQEIVNILKQEGYTINQLSSFKEHYRNEITRIREKEKTVARDERIANRILKELYLEKNAKQPEEEPERSQNKKQKSSEEKKQKSGQDKKQKSR